MPTYSGLYNQIYGENYTGPTITPNALRRLRRAFKGLTSLRNRQILRTLITNDVGTVATKSHVRLAAQDNTNIASLGGKRTVEVVSDINRAVTAADRTVQLTNLDNVHTPVFPIEKSGNSGGGKLGF